MRHKIESIKGKDEIKAIFKEREIEKNTKYVKIIAKKSAKKNPGLLIIITKKLGNAVERNKLRRRIKHIIMKLADKMKESLDIIILAKEYAKKKEIIEIEKEVKAALRA